MNVMKFLLELALMGLFVASLEMAFQFFMSPNMILYPYGVLLAKVSHKNEVLRHLMRPLGRCPYCNGTWVAFYVYKYFYGVHLPVLLLIGFVVLIVWLLKHYVFTEVEPAIDIDDRLGIEYVADTGVAPMMWTYAILAGFYSIIYLIPMI